MLYSVPVPSHLTPVGAALKNQIVNDSRVPRVYETLGSFLESKCQPASFSFLAYQSSIRWRDVFETTRYVSAKAGRLPSSELGTSPALLDPTTCAWIIEMRFGTGEHLLLSNRAGGQSVRIDPQAGGDEKKERRGDCGRQNPGHSILAMYNVRGEGPFLPFIPFWRVRHRRPTWTGSAISALIRVSGLRYARLTMRGGLRATSLAIFGSRGRHLGGDLGGLWRRSDSGDPQVGQSRVESPP